MHFGEVASTVLRSRNLRVDNLFLVPEQLEPLLAHIDVLHTAALGCTLSEADGCSGVHSNRNRPFDLYTQFFRPESNV